MLYIPQKDNDLRCAMSEAQFTIGKKTFKLVVLATCSSGTENWRKHKAFLLWQELQPAIEVKKERKESCSQSALILAIHFYHDPCWENDEKTGWFTAARRKRQKNPSPIWRWWQLNRFLSLPGKAEVPGAKVWLLRGTSLKFPQLSLQGIRLSSADSAQQVLNNKSK